MFRRRCWRNTTVTCILSFMCVFCWRQLLYSYWTSKRFPHVPDSWPRDVSEFPPNDRLAVSRLGCNAPKDFRNEPYKRNLTVKRMMDYNPRPMVPFNFTFSGCEFSNCAMTSDPAEADLLMINAFRIQGLTLPPRPAGQIWLLYTREPPAAHKIKYTKRPDLINQFNWTRTVLKDSTFPVFYGRLSQRAAPNKDYEAIYKRKKHVAAWFVSKCQTVSRREDYVRRMAPYVSVHVYGECGNQTCGSRGYDMGGRKDECLNLVSQSYMFYLSFENSLCRGYITEKFFNMFSDVDVIPVVRGGGEYRTLFPPGIFVNSDDFPSPEVLGRYLDALSRDKMAYIRMLQRKDR